MEVQEGISEPEVDNWGLDILAYNFLGVEVVGMMVRDISVVEEDSLVLVCILSQGEEVGK